MKPVLPVTKTVLLALKAAGIKVRIRHKRYARGPGLTIEGRIPPITSATLIPWARKWEKRNCGLLFCLYPHGGETTVNLIFPDGGSYTGVAKCSFEDRFDRREGIRIALNRALNARKAHKIMDQPSQLPSNLLLQRQ